MSVEEKYPTFTHQIMSIFVYHIVQLILFEMQKKRYNRWLHNNIKASKGWVTGVDPVTKAWEASVIPLHYTRNFYLAS